MNSKISCLLACAAALAGCTSTPPLDMARGTPVFASGQTEPVASRDDAADDPAIWVNASDPAQSLIVGTDKQAGLYVYGLDGAVRHFSAAGRVNNVDIRDGISFGGEEAIIVAASDRADIANAHILFFRLNTDPVRLDQIARIPAGPGEAYGFCLGRAPDGLLHAFLNTKEGSIHHLVMDFEGEPQIVRQRTLQVPSQPEGCVVDERTGIEPGGQRFCRL
jgi:3-phytase